MKRYAIIISVIDFKYQELNGLTAFETTYETMDEALEAMVSLILFEAREEDKLTKEDILSDISNGSQYIFEIEEGLVAIYKIISLKL